MPLNAYTVTGKSNLHNTAGHIDKIIHRSVSSNGVSVIGRPKNLIDRYKVMHKFRLVVKVQGSLSQGHMVDFMNTNGKRVSGGITDVNGEVIGLFDSPAKVTALIYDKAGGDSYNTLIRRDLQPVPYAVRGVDEPA